MTVKALQDNEIRDIASDEKTVLSVELRGEKVPATCDRPGLGQADTKRSPT